MILPVTVSKEDVLNGIHRSPLYCAVALVLGRQFPGKVAFVGKGRLVEGKRVPQTGVVNIFHQLPLSFQKRINPLQPWTVMNTPRGPEEMAASYEQLAVSEYLVGFMPDSVSDWLDKFDRGQITEQDIPFSFELNLLTRAENRDRLEASLVESEKNGLPAEEIARLRKNMEIRFKDA